MSFNLSDVDVKRHFDEFFRQKREAKFSLLITGKTGVGKSSLVNALFGTEVRAREGNKKFADTVEVIVYTETKEGVNIRVWDSPGLEDGTGNDEKYLAEINSKITEELDLVIFCLKMDDTRFNTADQRTLKRLTETFGKSMWKNAVIALTFANKVDHPAREDKDAYFLEDLAKWREAIQKFLRENLQLDPELVQSLPLVPTGYHRKPSVLPTGANWLPKFWIACYHVARRSTAFSLYRINRARVRLRGSEVLAATHGGSEVAPATPGVDDSEMSPIDLDEEQRESFWNTTWEEFREYCLGIGVVLSVISTVGIVVLKAYMRGNKH